MAVARVVDEHPDGSNLTLNVSNCRGNGGKVGDIQHQRVGAAGGEGLERALGLGGADRADDRVPGLQSRLREGTTKAGTYPGDQEYLRGWRRWVDGWRVAVHRQTLGECLQIDHPLLSVQYISLT